ncbi:MAG: hypothetical protein IT459_10255 [Planctomycetes bacterium]|nr:hypothetical protein [Planctomycetota bacterium]
MKSIAWAVSCALVLCACSSTPSRVDPLRDPSLLPAASAAAVVRRDATLALTAVTDARAIGAGERAVVDDRLVLPVHDLVRDYLRAELDRASGFARASEPSRADFTLAVSIVEFGSRLDESVTTSDGNGRAVLRATLVRTKDGATLLDRTYAQEVSEKRVMLGEVDPVRLAGHALAHVTSQVLSDLARVDLQVAPSP